MKYIIYIYIKNYVCVIISLSHVVYLNNVCVCVNPGACLFTSAGVFHLSPVTPVSPSPPPQRATGALYLQKPAVHTHIHQQLSSPRLYIMKYIIISLSATANIDRGLSSSSFVVSFSRLSNIA